MQEVCRTVAYVEYWFKININSRLRREKGTPEGSHEWKMTVVIDREILLSETDESQKMDEFIIWREDVVSLNFEILEINLGSLLF